jgi:hypothetical protein
MTQIAADEAGVFGPVDDGLHAPGSDSFYETETWWFSFFVPSRAIGAWVYASVRQHASTSGGGAWIWDKTGPNPWDAPFFQQFSQLKLPGTRGPDAMEFTTGLTVRTIEPGSSYDLSYDDRARLQVRLRFDALEPNVPLRSGAPPYPRSASHYDQTGRVTGHFVLDGERTDVDCFAMRDRSWSIRTERGTRRVGYTWVADADLSMLTYTTPDDEDEERVHSGYVRREGQIAQITGGRRRVRRDHAEGWVTAIDVEVTDALGRTTRGHADATSRLILPGAMSVCINSCLDWVIDDRTLHGEDQDVWPVSEFRARRHPSARTSPA